MKRTLWTEDEENILLKNLNLSNEELGKLLNKTTNSINSKKKRLGIKKEKEKYKPLNGEKFKKIKELENKFLISNYGTVINLNGIEMKQTIMKNKKKKSNGYKIIKFSINGESKTFRIHRLVALYFIKNDDREKIHVNHIDGNSLNNHYTNLEWCTPKENSIHAIKIGLFNPNQNNKLTEEDVKDICTYLTKCSPEETFISISKKFNIHDETLRSIYHGKSWKNVVNNYKANFIKLNSIK